MRLSNVYHFHPLWRFLWRQCSGLPGRCQNDGEVTRLGSLAGDGRSLEAPSWQAGALALCVWRACYRASVGAITAGGRPPARRDRGTRQFRRALRRAMVGVFNWIHRVGPLVSRVTGRLVPGDAPGCHSLGGGVGFRSALEASAAG